MLAKILLPMFNEIYSKSIQKPRKNSRELAKGLARRRPKSKTKQEKLPSLIRVSLKPTRKIPLSKEAGTEVLDRF